MKKTVYISVWLFMFLVCVIFSQQAFAQSGLTRIADNVYSYVDVKGASPANSFGANAGIIIGKNGIIVVDTLVSAKEARRFLQDIRKISDKPVRYVVNTHYHLDHAFGNSEFEKLGAVIVSHAADKKAMEASGEDALKNAKAYGLTEDDMAGTKITYPALTFTDRMQIDLGDRKVDLIYMGASHTGGSVVVHVPDQKILFAGDILFTNFHPFIAEGDMEGWLKALDAVMGIDAVAIIPGHGPLSGKKDLQDMKDYLTAFDKKARELCAQSGDIDYISSEIKKALPQRQEGGFLVKTNLQMKYMKKDK